MRRGRHLRRGGTTAPTATTRFSALPDAKNAKGEVAAGEGDAAERCEELCCQKPPPFAESRVDFTNRGVESLGEI